MQALPVAILKHAASTGVHHDLLVRDPTVPPDASHRLWAARVALPPRRWHPGVAVRLTPLPHHRERYLTYQGPISDRRGAVVRVDQGSALPHRWTSAQVDVLMQLSHAAGRLTAQRVSDRLWVARWVPRT